MSSVVTLQPTDVARRAFALERAVFAHTFGGDKLLLVSLEDGGAALERAFAECPTDPGRTWQPRSEPTHTETLVRRLLPDELGLGKAGVPPRPMRGAGLARVLEKRHYVLPLRKRPAATAGDAERISVGRSHACDIVLAHSTVSKLHAWLEHDDNDRLYVSDAGSTNFTRLAGRILPAEQLQSFEYLEELSFGDVSARVCPPELLWDALHVVE
ncbi:MAG: FHA domain-containing protein [Myxococcales bacterium]|nr:FHA domain-containing protein [Myxococcales bacterium]